MSMIMGGALLLLTGAMLGELSRLDFANVSLKSWLAFWYLVVFGALVAFSAYLWLMRETTPTRAATYAYVNPVVAVLLGWLLAAEPLNPRVMTAAVVIIGAVALIVTEQGRRTSKVVGRDTEATGSTSR
jgi:drug/metabolite transporter (DMT)-like permease